ncbi:hypothetical protein ABK040_007911 [Willaertia magna]
MITADNKKLNVLIIGWKGLARKLASHFYLSEINVSMLVTPKKELKVIYLKESGDIKIFVEDLESTDVNTLEEIIKGHSIIINCSSFSNFTNEYKTEKKIIKACKLAKVDRYFTNDFSIDYSQTRKGDCERMDLRKRVLLKIKKRGLNYTSVVCGIQMESLFKPKMKIVDFERQVMYFYNSSRAYFDVTCQDDIVNYVTDVITDSKKYLYTKNKIIKIYGDRINLYFLNQILSELSGHWFALNSLGTLYDLDKEISDCIQLKNHHSTKKQRTKLYYETCYRKELVRFMFSGDAKVDPSEEESVKMTKKTSVKDFIRTKLQPPINNPNTTTIELPSDLINNNNTSTMTTGKP